MTPKPLRDTLWQAVGYTPSAEQLYAHDDPARFKLIAGGIRGGKSYSASKELVYWIARWAAKHSKDTDGGKRKLDGESSLWWIVGPTYELCRPEYLYVAEDLINIGMVKKNSISMARTGPLTIRLPFGTIETKSAEDIVKIAGVAPDGIIVCEVAQLECEAWQRMFERASQKRAPIWASGCVTGDTWLYTSDGMCQLKDLSDGTALRPYKTTVRGLDGRAETSHFYADGASVTVRVRTQKAFELEGTPNHRVQAITQDGHIGWVELQDLRVNDYVAIQRDIDLWGSSTIDDPYLLGLYVAEGCCSDSDRITITTSETETAEFLAERGFHHQSKSYHWRKTDHVLCAYWRSVGLDLTAKATGKALPDSLFSCSKNVVRECLRGMFDGDGCAHRNGRVTYATASITLAKQLQTLLLNFGVVASISEKMDKLNGKQFVSYIVDLNNDSARFYERIGFALPRKQALADKCRVRHEYYPYQRPKLLRLYREVPKRTTDKYQRWYKLAHDDRPLVERESLQAFIAEHPDDELEWLLKQDIYWAKVLEKTAGFAPCYDLVVPEGVSYTGSGFILHNTFETSMGWYPREWNEWQGPNKLGGKSFSIPTWANLAVYPGGRQDPEILLLEASLTPEQFQERCGAVPCPPSTLVFKEFDTRKHVKKMTMAKKFAFVCQKEDGTEERKQSFGPDDDILEIELPWDEPVEVWIDPGYAGAYAVLAVMWVGDCAFIFDEVYETHKTAREVIETCRAKTWWKRVKYGVMDVAGRQHQGMESHEEIWQAKAGIPISAEYVPVADGIERHRTFLASGPNGLPRLFLSDNCRNTSKEYGLYKYRDDKDGRPTREEPISAHDHAMKCIAYGLVHKVGYVRRPKQSEYLYISPFSDFTAVKKQDKSLPWPLRD